ncbi:putative deah-box rna helicase protein [Botrytis fragariae]|uniref:RNA helicase n=1 Tax=Botrytis fragariae TaxID=1964551 RepID=A0A8H6AP96_9HELO|nr:putative deah-box rna helicase protein [Botrytis fragariae]KAF5871301.1 putative deah-box rna helicase protein [Botrytis fragariae]
MPPKFTPRQRKHKVLARNKVNDTETPVDSNATEILPSSKAAHEEKKQKLKAELAGDNKISGKKAKRLEKYIETKLRKDENRILIEKLSKKKEEGGLYESSKKLGQGSLTRRERLARALKERERGIDIDGDGEELLFEKRTIREMESESSEDEDDEIDQKKEGGLFQGTATATSSAPTPKVPAQTLQFGVGTGLKRPLEVDDDGKPVIKKRQRRGGVKSRISSKPQAPAAEPAWEGFSSNSEVDSDEEMKSDEDSDNSNTPDETDDKKRAELLKRLTGIFAEGGEGTDSEDSSEEGSSNEDNNEDSDDEDDEESEETSDPEHAQLLKNIMSIFEESKEGALQSALGNDKEDNNEEGLSDEDSDEGSSEESSEEEDEDEVASRKQERSSAFKAWATQQVNEAYGYEPSSNIPNATETPRIEGFEPRPLEQDPLPVELQPTTNLSRKAFSVSIERPSSIQDVRLKLPVVAEEQKIMEAIHNNNLVVVYGATGSGKTTQVPQFLYEAGYGTKDSPNPGMIGVTQPRRVAAVSMAKRVGDELADHGKRVAYQIRFEGTVSSETAIKFMTDGVLLREVAQDIALRKYSAIVIDEAHERSVNTDILIGMLSRVVKLREEMAEEDPSIKPLKLIIMSATLRITDFTENKTLFSTPPPVLQAEGRQYPVTTHFARKTHHDYVEEAFRKISKGHRKLPPGGILVFLTGQNEITHLSKKLKEAFKIGSTTTGPQVRISGKDAPMEAEDIDFGETMDTSNDDYVDDDDEVTFNDDEDFDIGEEADTGPSKMHILPLYSLLPTKEQLRVFEPPPDGSRLIVLATNVAETSLTIPGIRYVFDCGRSKERKYDKTTGVQSFEVGWISKASASQRAGRAGRTGPGHCYRFYSSAVYERDFEEFAEPEILRMPIEGVVLQLKSMNLQHVVNFPFPTPPDRQSLASSEKLLTYLSAISPSGQITPTGSTMSIFPLSPRFARILLVGHLHDCLPYTIALVAGLSAADIFIPENQVIPAAAPREDEDSYLTTAEKIEQDARANLRRQFNKVHQSFCFLDDRSDAIKLLQAVGEFAHEPTESWCASHYVRYKTLKEISQLRRQITDLLRTNIPAFAALKYEEKLAPPTAKQVKALKQMVAAGFIDHVAIRADLAPTQPEAYRKPKRAIDVPYLTLFPSHLRVPNKHNDEEQEQDKAVYIHPASPLSHLSPNECPEYIIYSYLQKPAEDVNADGSRKRQKTRMHSLTDVTGGQLAGLAKGTSLLEYGKPIKEVMVKDKRTGKDAGAEEMRECWVVPYLRAEGTGGLGWPLPARKVVQKKVKGRGWVVE